jgi:hypothetical protein
MKFGAKKNPTVLKALSNEIGFTSHLYLNRKKFPPVFRKGSIVILGNQTRHQTGAPDAAQRVPALGF